MPRFRALTPPSAPRARSFAASTPKTRSAPAGPRRSSTRSRAALRSRSAWSAAPTCPAGPGPRSWSARRPGRASRGEQAGTPAAPNRHSGFGPGAVSRSKWRPRFPGYPERHGTPIPAAYGCLNWAGPGGHVRFNPPPPLPPSPRAPCAPNRRASLAVPADSDARAH